MTILHHPLINQARLAAQVGVSKVFLHNVKTGKKPMPAHVREKLIVISKQTAQELGDVDTLAKLG